ncbi:hypothetical protein [Arthrobacter sp. R4-81]
MTVTMRRNCAFRSRLFLAPATVLVLVLTTVLSVAGAAGALWLASGSGSGTGTTAVTASALALTPGASASGVLYPGGNADVLLTISNPNTAAVHLAALTVDPDQGAGGYAVDPGHSGCALTALAFSSQSNGGAGWTVPGAAGAFNGTLTVTLANGLTMSADANSACQGARFTVFLEAQP